MIDIGKIPKEFFQSCSQDEKRKILETGTVCGEAVQRLWRMCEYQGPAPDQIYIFVTRESLDKFLAKKNADRL